MEYVFIMIALGIFAETTYLTYKTMTPANVGKGSILLDTSVLIDGRILSIARSGLIGARLLVPTSVVRELQFMADKADHDKRERARFGLETIEKLQELEGVQLEVVDDGVTDMHGVDEQLIRLAQKWSAKLCTIDYNLNKSARVQAVEVININELAHALRVTYLPGEELEVKLIQQGQDPTQAVGYLDDGTMVVVDNAKAFIGQTLTVQATRVLQTAAGKMMFARRTSGGEPERKQKVIKPKQPKQPQAQEQRTVPKQQRRPQQQGQGQRQNQQQNRQQRRPKTHEDALVELANTQQPQ